MPKKRKPIASNKDLVLAQLNHAGYVAVSDAHAQEIKQLLAHAGKTVYLSAFTYGLTLISYQPFKGDSA